MSASLAPSNQQYGDFHYGRPPLSDVPVFGWVVDSMTFDVNSFAELLPDENYYVIVRNYTMLGDDCPIKLTPELLMDCDLFQIELKWFPIIKAQEYNDEVAWMRIMTQVTNNTLGDPTKIQQFNLHVALESLPKTYEEGRRILVKATKSKKMGRAALVTPIIMMED